MLATLALLTRRWGRLARADLIRHGVLTGVLAAALCIAYPEPTPFLALAYTLIGLAALLAGEFNRRGQSRRILLAVAVVVVTQIASLGLVNLTTLIPMVAPFIYLLPLSVIGASAWILLRPLAAPLAARRIMRG